MNSFTQQQQELEIQRGIRQAEDDIVTLIQNALDQTYNGKLEESQFRNLVRVAATTESPEVIKNFLRYQVGREEKWGRGKDSLANKIISNIENDLYQAAKEIAKASNSNEVKAIQLELIRRYLGYGARYLKYLNSCKQK